MKYSFEEKMSVSQDIVRNRFPSDITKSSMKLMMTSEINTECEHVSVNSTEQFEVFS